MEETDIQYVTLTKRQDLKWKDRKFETQQKNSNFDRVQFVHYTIASAIVFAKITVSTYAFLMKRGTNLIVLGMKDSSEVKGQPFSSSLNFYPEAYTKLTIERGGGGRSKASPLPRHHHPPYFLPSVARRHLTTGLSPADLQFIHIFLPFLIRQPVGRCLHKK